MRFSWTLASLVVLSLSFRPAYTQNAPKNAALDWVDTNAETLKRVNKSIWEYAEVGLEEHKSAKELMDLLRENGFSVEAGVAGMPTAFVASYGTGRPVIGILAEYDALPGLSQEAEPERKERPGVENGHGCGHSVFGTASTGAAIAVKNACTGSGIGEKGMLVAAKTIAGTAIDLYGSPELIAKARADFEKIREPLTYRTLIPEAQKAPKAIR